MVMTHIGTQDARTTKHHWTLRRAMQEEQKTRQMMRNLLLNPAAVMTR
jgi:hypothetical protein